MKHRNPKKLAQRIVGIILLTGGNLIATTLYLPEFRYVPELFERLQMYRAIALVLGITGAIIFARSFKTKYVASEAIIRQRSVDTPLPDFIASVFSTAGYPPHRRGARGTLPPGGRRSGGYNGRAPDPWSGWRRSPSACPPSGGC